jgi:hypothetical protein
VEGSCEHSNKPSGSIKCWEVLSSRTIGGFSRRAQLHGVSWLLILRKKTFYMIRLLSNVSIATRSLAVMNVEALC